MDPAMILRRGILLFILVSASQILCDVDSNIKKDNVTIVKNITQDANPATYTNQDEVNPTNYTIQDEVNSTIDIKQDLMTSTVKWDDENSTIKEKVNTSTIIQDDIETTTELNEANLDGVEHPCYRKCVPGKTMICHYTFVLEWYQAMSKACFNCPYNVTDCDRIDCIPADGIGRPLTVVNRKMPGPSVEVCKGDTIVVDVENTLMAEGTTVHWHGHHQRGTPYMDGVPLVTQCPISPESVFRYTFTAVHAGTHFWHSHAGMQRADGAFGAFIVRDPGDRHASLYDFDRSEDVMIVMDWIHELGISAFTSHHHSNGTNKPPSLLVNGRGRYKNPQEESKAFVPAAKFNVEQGYRYRFRVINAEFLNCPIEMSVDKHKITVISSDGHDFEPVEAVSLVTYAGERFDFILEANQEIDNYWIKFRGLMDCDDRFSKARQVAVLHYEGAMEKEPEGDPSWEESHNDGYQINALNVGTGHNETLSIPELISLDGDDESLKPEPDMQYFISYDFYDKDNFHYNKYPHYGFYQVKDNGSRLYTPQLNHISMRMPSFALLPGRNRIDPSKFCNESTVSGCVEDYCECTHVVNVPLNSTVEMILVDEGFTFDANHPFHLHGYAFRVVAMERVAKDITVEQVKKLDAEGKIKRKLTKSPLKDTVTVPDGGYTVIRWYADNPGYWLFHCHIEFHVEIGMAIVFKVGEHSDFPPVPPNFPQCGSYVPEKFMQTPDNADYTSVGPVISITHWWPLDYFSGSNLAVSIDKKSKLLLISFIIISCFGIHF